jgi:hypothetical protein
MKTLAASLLVACAASAAEWVNISDAPIAAAQVKPGYAGPTAGVVVDRAGGAVFTLAADVKRAGRCRRIPPASGSRVS